MGFSKEKLKHWLFSWLIKFKRIKTVSLSAEELNSMLDANLPESFGFPVPRSKGRLDIKKATLEMPTDANHFEITLFCGVHIEMLANPIYRANIEILAHALPHFDVHEKVIQLAQINIASMTLVQDEYSLLKDTKYLMQQIVPGPVKSVLGVTMKTTLNIISNGTYDDARTYLSLYLDGSKQKVLDYHRPELEKIVLRLNNNGDLQYRLNEDVLEERLFADHGREVKVQNGSLQFVFHE